VPRPIRYSSFADSQPEFVGRRMLEPARWNQAARRPVRLSMKDTRLLALTAVALVGVSCAQTPKQRPSESSVASKSASPSVSVRNGALAFAGADFTAWLVAPDGGILAAEEHHAPPGVTSVTKRHSQVRHRREFNVTSRR